jgi:hypothetical protein
MSRRVELIIPPGIRLGSTPSSGLSLSSLIARYSSLLPLRAKRATDNRYHPPRRG